MEDRESDSDFDPEKPGAEAAVQQWDDEENFIADAGSDSNQPADSQVSQEEEDLESKSEAAAAVKSDLSGQEENADNKSMMSNQMSETSQIIAPKRRGKLGQLSAESSQAPKSSQASHK